MGADVHFTLLDGVCRERGSDRVGDERLRTVLDEAALNGDTVTFRFRIPEDHQARLMVVQEALLTFGQYALTPLIQLEEGGWEQIRLSLDPKRDVSELEVSFRMPIEGITEWEVWPSWRKHLSSVSVEWFTDSTAEDV